MTLNLWAIEHVERSSRHTATAPVETLEILPEPVQAPGAGFRAVLDEAALPQDWRSELALQAGALWCEGPGELPRAVLAGELPGVVEEVTLRAFRVVRNGAPEPARYELRLRGRMTRAQLGRLWTRAEIHLHRPRVRLDRNAMPGLPMLADRVPWRSLFAIPHASGLLATSHGWIDEDGVNVAVPLPADPAALDAQTLGAVRPLGLLIEFVLDDGDAWFLLVPGGVAAVAGHPEWQIAGNGIGWTWSGKLERGRGPLPGSPMAATKAVLLLHEQRIETGSPTSLFLKKLALTPFSVAGDIVSLGLLSLLFEPLDHQVTLERGEDGWTWGARPRRGC